jgi:hypothetical protein
MYEMPRLKGDPLSLIPLNINGEVVTFSAAGRATRVRVSSLTNGGRLMRTESDDRVIAAFSVRGRADFLLAAKNSLTQIASSEIPLTELNAQGTKVRSELQSVIRTSETMFALTTQRILPVNGAGTLKLNKDERLISLLTHSR